MAMVAERRLGRAGGPPITLRLHGANIEHQPESFRDLFHSLLSVAGTDVTLVGRYTPDQLPALMAAVDWVVVPSIWWENAPLVIQEAMAHGRPVICSDIGGMAEKVDDGVNGLHFRVGDPTSLADTMLRAAGTPGLWDSLHAALPPVHGLDAHLATLTAHYDRLMAAKRPVNGNRPVDVEPSANGKQARTALVGRSDAH
jgi:glycosyltransferase involved in cell wall biosynthesis